MPKARETWAWQEEITATTGPQKLDQAILDYVTRGQLIFSSCDVYDNTNVRILQPSFRVLVGSYPYDPTKQVYDRLTAMGAWQAAWQAPSTGPNPVLQYSIDDCASWVDAPFIQPPAVGAVWPCAAMNASYPYTTGYANVTQDWGSITLDLSSISAFVDLAFSFGSNVNPVPVYDVIGWWLTAFLWSSADTPF